MKRALFVTVAANELYMPVAAWRNNMGPCAHITFNTAGPPNDEGILACAKGYAPDVIFYIGANSGLLPTTETLKALRDLAPCIHYQSDVEDEAWFDLLKQYRKEGCFDLIVSQTGVKTDLIDMATLIAVDMDAFDGAMAKDIVCGFSGSVTDLANYKLGSKDAWDGRAEVLKGLGNALTFRAREAVGSYHSYAAFLKRCRFALNVSLTGSGKRHHVKWRVLEAAFAGCALLEMKGSPTAHWFPSGSYFTYENSSQIKRILGRTLTREFVHVASVFSCYAREHYTPRQIFSGILEALPA